MKTLTKKQRREIYLKAYRIFVEKKNFNKDFSSHLNGRFGMCTAFDSALRVDISDLHEWKMIEKDAAHPFWFLYDDEGDECRMNVLLFCAEMCKP